VVVVQPRLCVGRGGLTVVGVGVVSGVGGEAGRVAYPCQGPGATRAACARSHLKQLAPEVAVQDDVNEEVDARVQYACGGAESARSEI
jgi:hypothetical protein